MCRWITLISSEPFSLSDVIFAPSNSLIQLAKDASFHPGYDEINNAQVRHSLAFIVVLRHSLSLNKLPSVVLLRIDERRRFRNRLVSHQQGEAVRLDGSVFSRRRG